MTHRVRFLHKNNGLHREEAGFGLISVMLWPTGLASTNNCTGRGKKESERDRKSKGLKVEKASNSGFRSLPPRHLSAHSLPLKYTRELGKEQRKTTTTATTTQPFWIMRKQRFSTILGKSVGLTYEIEVAFCISVHAGCSARQFTSWLMKICFYIQCFTGAIKLSKPTELLKTSTLWI